MTTLRTRIQKFFFAHDNYIFTGSMRVASFKVALLREINKFEFLMCCLDTCTPDPTLLDTCNVML